MDCLIQMLFLGFKIIFLAGQEGICTKIIGGHEVDPHSRPYMASIQMNKQHVCGGVLIARSWVLTAAHCEENWKYQDIQVILGAHSLSKRQEEKQQVLKVKKYFPYPEFNWNRKENDIMLIQLANEAIMSEHVSILKLPKSPGDVKAGTKCSVAGWGTTNPEIRKPSDTLREVTLTVIARKRCNSEKYYNYNPFITKTMLCAGDAKGRKDSCQGDSGGPLICKISKFRKIYEYRGIVSAGDGCAKPKKPGIYTRLSEKYLNWINKVIAVRTHNKTFHNLLSSFRNGNSVYIRPCIMAILENIGSQKFLNDNLRSLKVILSEIPGVTMSARFGQMSQFRVVLGAHSHSKKQKWKMTINVKEAFPHPRFEMETTENDIIKLQLNGKVTPNKFVNVLNPPNTGTDVKDGDICNAPGCGLTSVVTEKVSDTLQQVNVTVVDRMLCAQVIQGVHCYVMENSMELFLLDVVVDNPESLVFTHDSQRHIIPGLRKQFDFEIFSDSLRISCIFKHHKVKAVLGIDILSKKKSAQIITVKEKFPHIRFDNKTKENDIMLLQLQSEAKLNNYVKLLPLPKNDLDMGDGTVCSVAGWGWTKINSNVNSDHLKEVNVTIINRSKCNSPKYYNKKPLITMNMLCAGDKRGGKDACCGDSGGPLICKDVFRGIVSYGKKCGLAKKPGIYTRLTKEYMKWIQKKTA
ncbi:uncharacterized protein LOC125452623 [Stegostoma tigrinum]|uniref:uncharacterized protein LOC125452623 n=1 Tax=Stegostoma tigrinum TaxID=3053191 RepID=UPI0028708F95|nr:uncharacterized protein LOC125452623 [Stegostoma tigrinum]